jgi:hypothetical protein
MKKKSASDRRKFLITICGERFIFVFKSNAGNDGIATFRTHSMCY